jgi:hypothetical protein
MDKSKNDAMYGFIPIAIIIGLVAWQGSATVTKQEIEKRDQQIQQLQAEKEAFKDGVIYGQQ